MSNESASVRTNIDRAAGERFLANFRKASSDGDPLEVLVSDTDGFAAALAKSPDDLANVLQYDADHGPTGPAFIQGSAFASAACDDDGRLLLADEAFNQWVMPREKLQAALGKFDSRRPSISFLVEDRGKFIAVAAAPLVHSKNWPLSPAVKAFLEAGHAKIAVIARLDGTDTGGVDNGRIIGALRLTGLEARVCAGLVKAGSARGAAALAGVSYETARAELKVAMKKAGVGNQAELISLLMSLTSGELSSPQLSGVLRDVFSLSDRQTSIALAAARGLDRKEIAGSLGISPHLVKSELSALFNILSVETMGNLSRAIAQIRALTALAGASGVEIVSPDQESEPLQLLPRKGRKGRIAFADHGPVGGLPCLIIHSPTTSRHLPPSHVKDLQAFGLRPIGFDRPGTGLSDMVDGDLIAQTAADMAQILDALSIEKTCIIARGGSILLAYFAAHFSKRFNRGVALNPDPRPHQRKDYLGIIGEFERAIFGRPKITALLVSQFSQRSATKTVESLVRKSLKSSPADMATLREPGVLKAYVRATQQAALQNGAGFFAIHTTDRSYPNVPIADGSAITILAGSEDPLCNAHESSTGWQSMWPGCTVQVIEGTGRLLAYQRPDLIAKALLGET